VSRGLPQDSQKAACADYILFLHIYTNHVAKLNAAKTAWEHSLFVVIAWEPWGRPFLSRFTNSRCAGYILFLDTYPDNPTNLSAAKTGFPLVNLERNCSSLSRAVSS